MKFKVGDLVLSKKRDKTKGLIGTVKLVDETECGVQFPSLKGQLHDCRGTCPDRDGWFVYETELEYAELDWQKLTGCFDGI